MLLLALILLVPMFLVWLLGCIIQLYFNMQEIDAHIKDKDVDYYG